MKSNALSRLIETARRPVHDRRPSIETFADIDANRLALELALERLGSERGARQEPPSTSASIDDVEARAVERIEAVKKEAHALVEDELRTYAERLASLDFEGRFSAIRQSAPACVGEFKAEVAKGLDELHGLRRDLRESEEERDAFRRDHRLSRTARVHSGAATFLKVAIIIALFLIEAIVNGNFLAKGSEQGLLGGVTEAVAFAALNIGVALILALFGVVQLNHRSIVRRFLGLVSFAAFVAFTVVLNLALAHYRDVSTTFAEGGGAHVVQAMLTRPLELSDVNSWTFFGIGVLFSVLALIDGLYLSDPYPGYSTVQSRLVARRQAYSERKADLIDELKDVRDDYRDEIDEISQDLSKRRAEHDAILANRTRLLHLFAEHQNHLERSLAVLLSTYRDANIKARKTPPPARFSSPHVLDRIQPSALGSGAWQADELKSRIGAAQDLLTTEVQAIYREFEAAVDKYRQLDDLVPEGGGRDGPPRP